MTVPETRTATPPYLPYKTFTGFLDELRDTAVPNTIDNSVMPRLSGTMRAQMRTALRFMGLINDDGDVQPAMRELIKARGTEKWKEVFGEHFLRAYADVLEGLDLKSGTLQQLKDRFRTLGIDGSVLVKSVRFFLSAIDETGTKYSPHFRARGLTLGVRSTPRAKSNRSTPQSRPKKNGGNAGGTSHDEDNGDAEGGEESIPDEFQRFSLPMKDRESNALLVVPKEMRQQEWEMLSAYIKMYFGFDG